MGISALRLRLSLGLNSLRRSIIVELCRIDSMVKNKKLQIVAILAILLFVFVMAAGEFANTFSIYHETSATNLNVGDKVYIRPQIFDTGGFDQTGAYHNSAAEKDVYNKLAGGTKCYAQQKTFGSLTNSGTWGSKWAFRATPTTSAGGKYYELETGSIWFTRYAPETNVYSSVFYLCDDNPSTYLSLQDSSKKYNFVASGGSTQTCNPTDCNAKSTNACQGEMIKATDYGCIDNQCVQRGSSLVDNAQCKNAYWTAICEGQGKTWDGATCVSQQTATPNTPQPNEPIPTLPSQAEIACMLSSGTWEVTTSTCLEAQNIADGEGAETGTNIGAENGVNTGGDDFVSKNKWYIVGAILGLFAWLAWLMPYLAKKK